MKTALQPKLRGWLLASVDGVQTGLVPANYLKILGLRNGNKVIEIPTTSDTSVNPLSPTPEEPAFPQPSTSRFSESELP